MGTTVPPVRDASGAPVMAGLALALSVGFVAGVCVWLTAGLVRGKAERRLLERASVQLERQASSLAANLSEIVFATAGRLQTLVAVQAKLLATVRERNAGYSAVLDHAKTELARREQAWSERGSLLNQLLGGGGAAANADPADVWGGLENQLSAGEALLLTDRYGGTAVATRHLPRYSWAQEPWWKWAAENRAPAVGIAGFILEEAGTRPLLVVALPVIDSSSGDAVAVVAAFLDVGAFLAPDRPGSLGKHARTWLVMCDGTVLFDSQAWTLAPGRARNPVSVPAAFLRREIGQGLLTEPGGREWRCGFCRLFGPGAGVPQRSALSDDHKRAFQELALTLVTGEDAGTTIREDMYALRNVGLVGAAVSAALAGLVALLCWGRVISDAQVIVVREPAAAPALPPAPALLAPPAPLPVSAVPAERLAELAVRVRELRKAHQALVQTGHRMIEQVGRFEQKLLLRPAAARGTAVEPVSAHVQQRLSAVFECARQLRGQAKTVASAAYHAQRIQETGDALAVGVGAAPGWTAFAAKVKFIQAEIRHLLPALDALHGELDEVIARLGQALQQAESDFLTGARGSECDMGAETEPPSVALAEVERLKDDVDGFLAEGRQQALALEQLEQALRQGTDKNAHRG